MNKMTIIEDKLFRQLFKGYIKNQRKVGFTMGTGVGILLGLGIGMISGVVLLIADDELVLVEDNKEEAGE